MFRYLLLFALFFSTLLAVPVIHNSYSFEELGKLTASDASASDEFGYSVSIDGSYAVVGAYQNDDNGTDSGSAYVFKDDGNGTFVQTQKLTASNAAAGDYFGHSVAISGDTLIVGALFGDGTVTDSGSAYIFKNNGSGTFVQSALLSASDGAASDFFGFSVAISGETAIVGARMDNSAYIYTDDGSGTFATEQKITGLDTSGGDEFGYSVAISGDVAIVGAHYDDSDRGSAYIFENNSGTFEQSAKLTASDGAGSDEFAYSVAISGSVAIVGSYSDKAYIYSDDGSHSYSTEQILNTDDPGASGSFGVSVAISSAIAIVSANLDDETINNSGSVFVYNRETNGTFTFQEKVTASDPQSNDQFGSAVALGGGRAIVGPLSSENAYVFTTLTKVSVVENSTTALDINATGATSFTLGGTDAARFDVNSSGTISFITPPDYEAPLDANGDNIYSLHVTARRGAEHFTSA